MYTTGADGALRAWSVDAKSGALVRLGDRPGAHEGRVEALAVGDGGEVYTGGFDGSIRMWCAETLRLRGEAKQVYYTTRKTAHE